MNSFSEQRSYRAALLNEKAELHPERGNDSATKRKGGVAHAATPTVPTVPQTTLSPVRRNSPSSRSFITPTHSTSSKKTPARAAAITSPPKAFKLANTKPESEANSNSAPVARIKNSKNANSSKTEANSIAKVPEARTLLVVIDSDGEREVQVTPSKADILRRIAENKNKKCPIKQRKRGKHDADAEGHNADVDGKYSDADGDGSDNDDDQDDADGDGSDNDDDQDDADGDGSDNDDDQERLSLSLSQ